VPEIQVEERTYALYTADAEIGEDAAEQLDYAARRFEGFFGTEPPRIAVVLFEHPEHVAEYDFEPLRERGMMALPWLTDEALLAAARRALGPLATRAELPVRALSHEACHMYLVSYVSELVGYDDPNERLAALEGPSYGDPLMPDWFDEAAALLCEPEEMGEERRAAMRREVDNRIPLAEFFQQDHPSAQQTARPRGDAAAPDRGPRITIERRERSAPDLFYSQALSVAEFLVDRPGRQSSAGSRRGLRAGSQSRSC